MVSWKSLNKNGEFPVRQNEYKAAAGKYPTGVTIISTVHNKAEFGFTANSFTSVSLEPPVVSFCLNTKAGSIEGFQESYYFAASILAADQSDVSNHFASHIINKFDGIDHYYAPNSGCPIINGAVSYIECKKLNMYEVGDHMIFTGEVLAVKVCNDKQPLLYFARGYHGIDLA